MIMIMVMIIIPCWSSCSLEGATPDQQHAIAWRIGEKKVLIWS